MRRSSAFRHPEHLQLPVIDVLLDRVAHQMAQRIGVDGVKLDRAGRPCAASNRSRSLPSLLSGRVEGRGRRSARP